MVSVGVITRNRAATICAVAASNFTTCCAYGLVSIAEHLMATEDALDLAVAAWDAATHIPGWSNERYAEAESMLRTGWTP